VLGTASVGTVPKDLVYDAANIWVANTRSNNVTKLGARSEAVLGTFAADTSPDGVAFDGVNIWAANAGSNTVSKF
jgi:DNA-binding beta-propeller fold protein YncE